MSAVVVLALSSNPFGVLDYVLREFMFSMHGSILSNTPTFFTSLVLVLEVQGATVPLLVWGIMLAF